MRKIKLNTLIPLALCMVASATGVAHAAPARPDFGPFIDEGAYYEGQTTCSPKPKPGVVAFQRLVVNAYPHTGAGYISRDCSVGGTSEHKEGRAWDWGVNVGVASQKAAADDLLSWLARDDVYGNSSSMAQRLGVMYAIWNKRIWFPSSGWRTYCVMRNGACRDPEDGGVRSPHTDHVHFSFTWRGARKTTTFWKPALTFAAGAARSPWGGLWALGRNGGIRVLGDAGYHGSKASQLSATSATAIAARPSGDGYWMLARNGRVFPFGKAPRLGYIADMRGTDIAATPSGKGYWILGPWGRVASFGDAPKLGSVSSEEGRAVAIAPTPTGAGYWVLTATGKIHPFGDAQHFGDTTEDTVDIASSPSGLGYWTTTAAGEVSAFGDAAVLEQPAQAPASPVVELVPTSSGAGYWLVTAKAVARPAGDAPPVAASYGTLTTRSFDAANALGLIAE